MNKSSSLLLHLHLHLLFDNEQIFIFKKQQKKKKKNQLFLILSKKKKEKIFKKGLGTRGIGLVILRLLSKKKKKSSIKIFNSFKKFKFSKFKKKKNSLNSSSRTESYDPLPHSPVMQHQVNYPPPAFFEAWSTRVKSPHIGVSQSPKNPWSSENMSQDPKILGL